MSEYIFGIKCNGVSIMVSQLTIDDDQTMFDYICNVLLKGANNGNGTYDVSIINNDYIQGMPIGKWRIKKAWIRYNWGDSEAKLIMEDKDGNETNDITADIQRGSVGGFHIPSLTKSIFTKAQEIVRDYPNAKICDAIINLNNSRIKIDVPYLNKRIKEIKSKSNEEYIEFIRYITDKISNYLNVYNETKALLEKNKDQRSKVLFKDISTECRKLLDSIEIKG